MRAVRRSRGALPSDCSAGGAIYERCGILPQDLVIAPVALGYYFIGRFWLAKSFVASRACDSCGSCVKQCPIRALELVHGRPFWSYRCEGCMRCMNQCPKRAIETAHGFAVGVPVLLSMS